MAAPGNDSAQERTEPATPKRIEDARRRGQVPRSRELTGSGLLLVSAAAMGALGPGAAAEVAALARHAFTLGPRPGGREVDVWAVWMEAAAEALLGLGPFLLVTLAVAVVAPAMLGGWNASAEAIAPKPEKLDPIRGLGRVFSVQGLMEVVKSLAKFLLVIGVLAALLWGIMDGVVALGRLPVEPALAGATRYLLAAFAVLAAATAPIAAVDVPFQLWQHARQLRMSRQELRDELKETEGKPEVKSRVRALQREIANRRMLEAVPDADVVVTNPTHYAVALRYRPGEMSAPRLVAKGVDHVAARIVAVAREHGVSVVSAPALARAIHRHTRLDREIPVGLYTAVAEILAYVMRLRRGERAPRAPDPGVPEELGVPPAGEEGA